MGLVVFCFVRWFSWKKKGKGTVLLGGLFWFWFEVVCLRVSNGFRWFFVQLFEGFMVSLRVLRCFKTCSMVFSQFSMVVLFAMCCF